MKLFALIFSLLLVTSVNAQQVPNRSITSLKLNQSAASGGVIRNLGLSATVSSNALTIALKQADGSTNASAIYPVDIGFRSSTITSGGWSVVSATGAASVVVSSGSTLGTSNSIEANLFVYAINNAGTIELAVINGPPLDEGKLYSTTAEGGAGAADSSGVLYSTTARSNVAVRLLARIKITEGTAGTWATAPTAVALAPFAQPGPFAYIKVRTGNGAGSTNTKIRRFSSIDVQIENGIIAYADSSTLGASFTATVDCLVFASYTDQTSGTNNPNIAFSLNSSQLTTDPTSLTMSDVVGMTTIVGNGATAADANISVTLRMKAGDVLRPHYAASLMNSTTTHAMIALTAIPVAY